MKNKWIKAKRCYICANLCDIKRGGWLIGTRFSSFSDIKPSELFLCPDCADEMARYVERVRVESEEQNDTRT